MRQLAELAKITDRKLTRVEKAIAANPPSALAAKCGLSVSYVSLLLRGKRTPKLPAACKLAKGLGVELEELADYIEGAKNREGN